MIQTTSTIEPPKSSVGEATGKIGAGVLTVPEKPTVMFLQIFLNALAAALRRNSVVVIDQTGIFSAATAAAVFTIPWSKRGTARAALKQVLDELGFAYACGTIALQKEGEEWVTHAGLGAGESTFGKAFLRPEYMDHTLTATEKFHAETEQFLQAAIRELAKGESPKPGENPEAP